MTPRPARRRDGAQLLALIQAMNAQQGAPTHLLTEAALRAGLIGQPDVLTHVVEEAGELLGYATAHPTYDTAHAERGLYVGDLFVAAAHRRRGVARLLLASLAAAGRKRGGQHLWLTAAEGNLTAHALYRSLGGRGERVVAFACVEERYQALADEARR